MASSCVNKAAFMSLLTSSFGALCPTATITEADVTATGSFSFTAPMSYTTMLSTTPSGKANVPASCLQGLTCTTFSAVAQLTLLQNPNTGIQSFSCVGTASCTCTAVLTTTTVSETGTYSTAGSILTTTPAGGIPTTKDYCVQGKTLHFITVDRTTNMAGQAPITTDIVATKD